jgi:hypothetical protein
MEIIRIMPPHTAVPNTKFSAFTLDMIASSEITSAKIAKEI